MVKCMNSSIDHSIQDELKKQVAGSAIEYIDRYLTNKSVVGVGTGSTTNYFIDALAEIKHKFDGTVSSSKASTHRLEKLGIKVFDLNQVDRVDVYVDGADECNEKLELIKGGGGAHTREKVVTASADNFVCIIDSSKMVKTLGEFPLPVEVIPMARGLVARELKALGGDPVLRENFSTDNGNIILDVHNLVNKQGIQDPVSLESRINNITGVVANGLFALRPADIALVGYEDGVKTIRRG